VHGEGISCDLGTKGTHRHQPLGQGARYLHTGDGVGQDHAVGERGHLVLGRGPPRAGQGHSVHTVRGPVPQALQGGLGLVGACVRQGMWRGVYM
jgi:hypothetical protein